MRKKNLKKLSFLLLITILFTLGTPSAFASNDSATYFVGKVTVSGTIESGEANKIVNIFVINTGFTANDFYNPENISDLAQMIVHFDQTATTTGGKYAAEFYLNDNNASGEYVIIADCDGMSSRKEFSVTYYTLKDLKEAMDAVINATDTSSMDLALQTYGTILGLDLTDYSNFDQATKNQLCTKILNLSLNANNLKNSIQSLSDTFNITIGLLSISCADSLTKFDNAIVKYNSGMNLNLNVYNIMGELQSKLYEAVSGIPYATIEDLQNAFIEKSILIYFNNVKLSGRIKEMVESNADIIGIDIGSDSIYAQVDSLTLYNNILKKVPVTSLSKLKTLINNEITSILSKDNDKNDDSDKKPSGGGGGGGGFSVVVTPTPTPVPTPAPTPVSKFADISSHWAKTDINYMYEKGMVKGSTDTQFLPENNITRAEVCALIKRVLNLTDATGSIFSDIAENDWYYGSVYALLNAGIISNDIAFRPSDQITRQEISKMIVAAYSYKAGEIANSNTELFFADENSIAPWAVEYIKKAVALEFIKGIEENGTLQFQAEANATRAQATVILRRLLDKM